MKNYKYLFVFFLLTSFFSCEKSEIQINNESFLKKRLLTESELISLGEVHNKHLKNYFKKKTNYQKKSDEPRELLINEFMTAKDFDWNDIDSREGLTYVVDNSIEMQSNNYSTDYYINNFNLTAQDFITRLDNSLTSANNITDLNNKIESIVSEIRNSNLSIEDKNGLLGYSYIMKGSSQLWAPVSLGGEGLYDDVNQNLSKNQKLGWSWRRAARGDAASSMIYFLGIGLTIIAPPAGLAVLTGWAWAAGAGSVVAGAGLV